MGALTTVAIACVALCLVALYVGGEMTGTQAMLAWASGVAAALLYHPWFGDAREVVT